MSELERSLARVLVEHQRLGVGACFCGWARLGGSHAKHVAQVQADTVRGLAPESILEGTQG